MAMRFYTIEKLGPKRSKTPEGYLLCEDVPVARTGQMIYGPDETPIPADGEDFVRIDRTDKEVFREESLASLNGKSLTIDHPPIDVAPDNWKELEVGVVMNPRRGKGAEDDLIFVDILVKDPRAIAMVTDDLPEVSAGYDAEYFKTGPAQGEQRNILFNHVALVEKGRCGPRCAIGDREVIPQLLEQRQMATPSKWLKRILDRAHDAKDEKELEAVAKDAAEEEEKARKEAEDKARDEAEAEKKKEDEARDKARDEAAEAHGARLDKLEAGHKEIMDSLEELKGKVGDKARDEEEEEEKRKKKEAEDKARDEEAEEEMAEEAPAGTGDRARKARDSAFLEESFQDTVALAEIIAPGIAIPTFDRAAAPIKSLDQMCSFRRKALDLAYVQAETRNMIDEVLAGKEFNLKEMKCNRVRDLFRAVGAMKRKANNTPVPRGWARDTGEKVAPRTLAEINKMNRERFAEK